MAGVIIIRERRDKTKISSEIGYPNNPDTDELPALSNWLFPVCCKTLELHYDLLCTTRQPSSFAYRHHHRKLPSCRVLLPAVSGSRFRAAFGLVRGGACWLLRAVACSRTVMS
uniref:Uncharacterized protein n=1 Tax=Anopheles dirus TaxID=7168 RepID=A0A182NU41_9DIPT